ncbi:MEP1B [Bugula neritina]|uniref:Metalloendopeptidase n=1 Tax=Bugula neritina TaxID=10212 RepID=A0A7J7KD10_BUGNE|nr:MEP1B [Bugula neritina]
MLIFVIAAEDRRTILAGINDYHKYTCLRLVPATSADKNRIRFQNGGGCSSYVGMVGGVQPVTLAPGCRYKGIVLHEIGHAIGFHHEQTRPDRDNYVSINTQNIFKGLEYNFQKHATTYVNTYGIPYDYKSMMHYSEHAFSKNGQPTIVARDRKSQKVMGNRNGFSFKDIQLANVIYECATEGTVAPGSCQDEDDSCTAWAKAGYCRTAKHMWYTSVKCKYSCKFCNEVTEPPTQATASPNCEDLHSSCPGWAASGLCGLAKYDYYLVPNCRKSCGRCGAATTPTTQKPTTTEAIAGCTDNHPTCSGWAEAGLCSQTYMLLNCKRSCSLCGSAARPGTADHLFTY